MRDWTTPSLNPTLSMTCKHARKVEVRKSILFQDPFESRKQFRTMSNNMEKLHNVRHSQHLCCGCTYETCTHFDNCHESEEVREYLSLTCLEDKKCSDVAFIPCCIEKIKNRKLFKDIDEAADFLTMCRHFKYERAYFKNFSLEGNLFENAIRHSICYFASINHQYDACVQNLNYVQLMTQWVKKSICDDDKPLTNALCKVCIICRSSFSGARCSMCEMQKKQDSGIEYVKIRPMTNKDGW